MKRIFLSLALAFYFLPCDGAWTLQDGKLIDASVVAIHPPEEHYRMGAAAMNNQDFAEAARQFQIVSFNCPETQIGKDSLYYLGVSYYHLGEYDFANDTLTSYLRSQSNPSFFYEAIEYKFCVAEQFRGGAKRHIWGTKQLPKWASATDLALEIYDEIAASLPNHEIALKSLYSKGHLLWSEQDWNGAVSAFQLAIKRFPHNELTPECYLAINRVYFQQVQFEFQNPDLLALAEINYKRFADAFPREERLSEAERDVLNVKEAYASGLYYTAQFYERTKQPLAAVLYYAKSINEFPETEVAKLSWARLEQISPNAVQAIRMNRPVESEKSAVDGFKIESLL